MKFLLRKRLIFEIILGIVFLGITIVTVIIAQGNIITPDGSIQETGVIEITSIPKDVTAFLDGNMVSISGNRIQNVLTGKKTLRLEKAGYTSWEKLIEVNNDKITYVYGQLYPTEFKRDQLFSQNINQLIYSEDRSKLVFSVLDNSVKDEVGIWKYDLTQGILSLGNPGKPSKVLTLTDDLRNTLSTFPYTMQISPDNSFLMLNVPDVKFLQVINLNNTNETINLVNRIGFYPEYVRWLGNSNTIIIKDKNLIYEQKIDGGQKNIIYFDPSKPPTFAINNQILFFVDRANNRLSYYSNGNSQAVELSSNTKNIGLLKEIKMDEVSALYLSQNQNVFIVQVGNSVYYIDKDSNYITHIQNISTIHKVAPDGLSFIYNNKETTESFVYDEVLKKNQSYVLKKTNVIGNIIYSTSGKQFTEVTTKGNLSTLDIFDIDGGNKVTLLKDIKLLGSDDVFVDSQSTKLYLVLNSSGTSQTSNYNLYVVDLDED